MRVCAEAGRRAHSIGRLAAFFLAVGTEGFARLAAEPFAFAWSLHALDIAALSVVAGAGEGGVAVVWARQMLEQTNRLIHAAEVARASILMSASPPLLLAI